MSALCRLCCKNIFGIWSRNIDSRSDTDEQQRFKRTDAPIRLLQISISQSLLGDFCNTICQQQTSVSVLTFGACSLNEVWLSPNAGEEPPSDPRGVIRI